MLKILVIGAGFAGVWSAASATRVIEEAGQGKQVQVTVVAPHDDIVIRPRLYEDNPEKMRVALDRVLGPIGVRRIAATVTSIDTDAHTVTAIDRTGAEQQLSYDRLVLAAGSSLVAPNIAGAEYLFDVDTMPAAARLHAHIGTLTRLNEHPGQFTAVVVGAGFTGLEVATELPSRLTAVAGERAVRVVLVDRGQQVAAHLGDGPRPQIVAALERHGVEVRQGVSVAALDDRGVTLTDGSIIPSATVIWTAGMRASALTEMVPGRRDSLGRLKVDEFLRVVGVADVYATGDCAEASVDSEHTVMQACQHAVPLGKHGGHNVAADLLGLESVTFAPEDYVTCLDLGPGDAVFTTGWERTVKLIGEEAKSLKTQINTEWIYPPVDDPETILGLADHRITWPIEQ
ncbi:MAG: FAD-dependent oxidoreductase [Kocuria sp.]|nr:FAD-dependent oxidoreductase [Kocuria sp.]